MHEIFEISLLDEFQDDELDIKAELSNTSESEMDAHGSIQEALKEAISDESYIKYENAYEVFIKWKESKKLNSFAEPVLLDYFHALSTKYKPSSLCSMYTRLKSTMISKQNIDISGYKKLVDFLKKKSEGYQSKKAKVFTVKDVNKFLVEAPDDKYLAMKTVLVFGVIGVGIVDKITNVKTDYVNDNGNEIVVRIPDPKTKDTKVYAIDGQYAEIVRKYMKLRPLRASTDRFFLQFLNGKCHKQVMGKNNIAKMPKQIAKFLKLPESEAYTGNSFRRTSTTISTDIGVAIEVLKLHGQHSSIKITEENVQESLGHKRKIDALVAEEVNSTSTSNIIIASQESVSKRIATDTVISSESSSSVFEISDESTGYIPEENSFPQNEGFAQDTLRDKRNIETFTAKEINSPFEWNVNIASQENVSERMAAATTTSYESSSLKKDERVATTDLSESSSLSENEAPRRKRKKRPKRQKENNWYDEECLAQIKLTTDMFKRFSNMREASKMKMIGEFSMHRIELFKKYFAAMNAVAINPINTPTTAASINTGAQNGGAMDGNGMIL